MTGEEFEKRLDDPVRRNERRYFDTLKRISQYDAPEKLRKHAEIRYGLDPEEAVEMAYENVISEAKQAIRGMRRP